MRALFVIRRTADPMSDIAGYIDHAGGRRVR
jgi:hypothetical protein